MILVLPQGSRNKNNDLGSFRCREYCRHELSPLHDLLARGSDGRFLTMLASAPTIAGIVFTRRGVMELVGASIAVMAVGQVCM